MKVLLIPASTPAALALARTLACEGHSVYGADEETIWGTAPARYSRAYSRFCPLGSFDDLSGLWASVGGEIDVVIPFDSLVERVHASAFGRATVLGQPIFSNEHEFREFVREKVLNAPNQIPTVVNIPASFTVHSRISIAEILSCYPSTIFSLQPAPDDEANFADDDTLVDLPSPTVSISSTDSRLVTGGALFLSCSLLDDIMVQEIKNLPLSETRPYRLTEEVTGGAEYSAHALIYNGHIRTFVVTTPAGIYATREVDYTLLPSSEVLFGVLYRFTMQVAEALEMWYNERALVHSSLKEPNKLRTQLTLNFSVTEEVKNGALVRRIILRSHCNQPHSSLVLLCAEPSLRRDLACAYTESKAVDGIFPLILTSTSNTTGVYSLPSVISEIARIAHTFAPGSRAWWGRLIYMVMMCSIWVVCFQEEIWAIRDPGPALYVWSRILAARLAEESGRFRWTGLLRRVSMRIGRGVGR